MKNTDPDIIHVAADETIRQKKFWRRAFAIYAIIEIIILTIQYVITLSKCEDCVYPPAYYLINWLQHLLFTWLLWSSLKWLNRLRLWKVIGCNVLLFTGYYFLWIALLYAILHSGLIWLVKESSPLFSLEYLIALSWPDIGKYVLKLTAFYLLNFYFEYRRAERQRVELAIINKDMQLNLLKQQLSPHFYFNTLNNLYGLARINSIKLSQALHQLSNIMQYVIVDCNNPKVLLQQEIDFLQSYIALEKLRYEHDIIIEIQVSGDAGSKTIMPLLLIQFVENAFKHGMKEKSDKNWMKVSLFVEKETLLFKVENSYYDTTAAEGIGISSVKNILRLQYEGKHDIEMLHEDYRFLVTLKLNLL
jgi:sensor histidine kinase YesM